MCDCNKAAGKGTEMLRTGMSAGHHRQTRGHKPVCNTVCATVERFNF
uniref:Uncharacterized protein n=1 Tax=Anguilla anguilla TaxID=7936 RepID=A0A0E9VTZ1_ANGAN